MLISKLYVFNDGHFSSKKEPLIVSSKKLPGLSVKHQYVFVVVDCCILVAQSVLVLAQLGAVVVKSIAVLVSALAQLEALVVESIALLVSVKPSETLLQD